MNELSASYIMTNANLLTPQIRIVCQMELSNHLLTASSFDNIEANEALNHGCPDLFLYMLKSGESSKLSMFIKIAKLSIEN